MLASKSLALICILKTIINTKKLIFQNNFCILGPQITLLQHIVEENLILLYYLPKEIIIISITKPHSPAAACGVGLLQFKKVVSIFCTGVFNRTHATNCWFYTYICTWLFFFYFFYSVLDIGKPFHRKSSLESFVVSLSTLALLDDGLQNRISSILLFPKRSIHWLILTY